MAPLQRIESNPQTLKEFNESRLMASEIITGKEFRKLKRKQQRKN